MNRNWINKTFLWSLPTTYVWYLLLTLLITVFITVYNCHYIDYMLVHLLWLLTKDLKYVHLLNFLFSHSKIYKLGSSSLLWNIYQLNASYYIWHFLVNLEMHVCVLFEYIVAFHVTKCYFGAQWSHWKIHHEVANAVTRLV